MKPVSLSNWIQLFSTLLVVLTIVYKAGKIEQALTNLVEKVDNNTNNIKDIQSTQSEHHANLAVLNQATGVYVK